MRIERIGQNTGAITGSSHMSIGAGLSKKLKALNFEPAVSLCGASTYSERELNRLLGRIARAYLPLVIAKDLVPPLMCFLLDKGSMIHLYVLKSH